VADIGEKGDAELSEFLANSLEEFFTHKKSRLRGPFLSKVFQRYPVLGRISIGKLLEMIGNARTGVMKGEAMRLLTGVLKPVIPTKGKKMAMEGNELAKAFEEHVEALGAVILSTVQSLPRKAAHKFIALQFCSSCMDALRVLCQHRTLHSVLDMEALLAGLQAIDVPSKGKLDNLIMKLVETVAAEVARNPVSIGTTTNAVDDNKTPSEKNQENGAEVPMEIEKDETPSKKKKKGKKSKASRQPEDEEELTPSKRKKARTEAAVQGEETPSKKKHQTRSKKAKVTKDSS